MPGMIISIINNKGGTGKTTTACNLAYALAKQEKKVLVIDMDSQCNTTQMLMPDGQRSRYSLYDVLDPENLNFEIERVIQGSKYKGVFCVPNVIETAAIEPQIILSAPASFTLFRDRTREYIQRNFDFALIDNPPNLGTFVICSLYSSDFAIVPSEAGSKYSLEGLVRAVEFIENIKSSGNPDLKFLRLLLTKADRRTAITHAVLDQTRSFFKEDKVFKTIIPVNTAFQQAEFHNEVIMRFNPKAKGAHAYRDLAGEVLKILSLD
jgi:chromosome partitioning protein